MPRNYVDLETLSNHSLSKRSFHDFDDTRLYIDKLGLTETQQEQIFSGNARRVYPKLDEKLKARGL